MKFFKQTVEGSCNVIAIQHALSFFDLYPTFEEINAKLPKHEFGSWLPEIGIHLGDLGFKTRLISNQKKVTTISKSFKKALDIYGKKGVFQEGLPAEQDIRDRPVIVNVDAFKMRKESGGPSAHYVVLINDGDDLWLYDGSNFKNKVKTTFKEVYRASLGINEFHENGMWLFLE